MMKMIDFITQRAATVCD